MDQSFTSKHLVIFCLLAISAQLFDIRKHIKENQISNTTVSDIRGDITGIDQKIELVDAKIDILESIQMNALDDLQNIKTTFENISNSTSDIVFNIQKKISEIESRVDVSKTLPHKTGKK